MSNSILRLAAVILAIVVSGASFVPANADESTIRSGLAVVELFTSQGCSSCPPADKLLGDLADRDNVIVLTLPVDYWDYLGWKDTLASRANTVRQKSYASARGDGQIYTPQVVVNGVTHAVGSRLSEIDAAIAAAAAKVKEWRAPLTASISKGMLSVAAGATANGLAFDGTVWMAQYRRSASVAVKSGENAGSKLTYVHVVRRLVKVGQWNGQPHSYQLSLKEEAGTAQEKSDTDDGCVVFLQHGDSGPIIAAVELRDWRVAY